MLFLLSIHVSKADQSSKSLCVNLMESDVKILSYLFGGNSKSNEDGVRVYAKTLSASRRPGFFTTLGFSDSYEGRIEVLTLHMSLILRQLRELGEQGERLGQGVFNAMVDDFDIALREEGLTDTSVSKRIKPLVRLFYTRAKAYDACENDKAKLKEVMQSAPKNDLSESQAVMGADYYLQVFEEVNGLSLGDFASLNFTFPKI